jgi:hypothetical protein
MVLDENTGPSDRSRATKGIFSNAIEDSLCDPVTPRT